MTLFRTELENYLVEKDFQKTISQLLMVQTIRLHRQVRLITLSQRG